MVNYGKLMFSWIIQIQFSMQYPYIFINVSFWPRIASLILIYALIYNEVIVNLARTAYKALSSETLGSPQQHKRGTAYVAAYDKVYILF